MLCLRSWHDSTNMSLFRGRRSWYQLLHFPPAILKNLLRSPLPHTSYNTLNNEHTYSSVFCSYKEAFEVDEGLRIGFVVVKNPLCQLRNVVPYSQQNYIGKIRFCGTTIWSLTNGFKMFPNYGKEVVGKQEQV